MDITDQTTSADAWETAVARMSAFGVFADEGRNFAPFLHPETGVRQFQDEIRQRGYRGGPVQFEILADERNGVDALFFDGSKFPSVQAAAFAWEREYRDRWHENVEKRVADWRDRLNDLKAAIQSWSPPDVIICDRAPISMDEDLMRRFDVPPVLMPAYDIKRNDIPVMRVQPKGLWTIGANGRVDLITTTASYILVDKAEPFRRPDWHYYSSSNRLVSTPFGQPQLAAMLGQ